MSDFLTSGATGEGYATVSRNGVVLDAWFPEARLAVAACTFQRIGIQPRTQQA